MKNNLLTVNFELLNISKTKTRQQWIDELAEYQSQLAYDDGQFCYGLIDDFLRAGFKGFNNMTDEELTEEIIENLEFKYDTEEA